MSENKEYITNSAKETENIAKIIANKFTGGTVIALSGDLGSGKTTFTKGMAKELGIKNTVSSPTFVLIKEYDVEIKNKKSNIKKFIHIDSYRLKSYKDAIGIGINDYFNKEFITVIEWPEKIKEILPADVMLIKFQYLDKEKRKITVRYNKKEKNDTSH